MLDNDLKLNYVISKFVKKMPKLDVLLFLKIGTYCLLDLSLPVYTVVNDVAELSKLSEDRRIVGFVNATLKTISANIANFDDYPTDELERVSVQYSYPMWALKKLVKDYGKQTAVQIVSCPSESRSTIRFVNSSFAQQFAQNNGVTLQRTQFDDGFYVSGKLSPLDDTFTVQSLSSMAVANVCANLTTEGSFLDSCSAPGGKAVYFKQLRPNVSVSACDIHLHRTQLIQKYASRMKVDLDVSCQDMTQLNDDFVDAFDTVLCDVPCSGFGVLNNRPDIKLFRQNEDIHNLLQTQRAILSNCANYVKVGGNLVYSTCTVFNNENGQNVARFLKEHPNFSYGKIVLPQFPNAHGQSNYQFLPHVDGVQGFYLCVLHRNY